MSDSPKTPPTAEAIAQEEIKNLKSEMNRKLGNLEETLKKSNQDLINMLKPKAAPAVSAETSDNLEDLFYKDPKAYAAKIEERTTSKIEARLLERESQTNQRNTTIAQLSREFPELNHDDHELTQLAIKKYNDMAKENGSNPSTYRAAVYEAALEQGIKPKSKRPVESDDDFSLRGSGGNRRAAKKSDELDPGVVDAAIAFGVDPERVKTRMKNRKKSITSWD